MGDFGTAIVMEYSECGPLISEEELNDWYNTERNPRYGPIPGVLSMSRWTKTDTEYPSWLTIYDIAYPDIAQTPAFLSLLTSPSNKDISILSRLTSFERRVYHLVGSYVKPNAVTSPLAGKYTFVDHIEVTSQNEIEFNQWCDDEHMPMLLSMVGWMRGRRYKLSERYKTIFGSYQVEDTPQIEYVMVHELDVEGLAELPTYWEVVRTPWRDRVMGSTLKRVLRLFERYTSSHL